MLSRTFKYKQDDEYGTWGWAPNWVSGANALDGQAVAHDCLEHFADDKGGAEGEFQALGAAYYVRGETGWFSNRPVGNPNAVDNISSDFIQILERVYYGQETLEAPPSCRKLGLDYADEDLDAIARKGVKEWLQERDGDEDISERRAIATQYRVRALGWMYRGYRRARRRYRVAGNYEICELFNRIAEQANRHLKNREEYEDGVKLRVIINIKRASAKVRCDMPYDEDY